MMVSVPMIMKKSFLLSVLSATWLSSNCNNLASALVTLINKNCRHQQNFGFQLHYHSSKNHYHVDDLPTSRYKQRRGGSSSQSAVIEEENHHKQYSTPRRAMSLDDDYNDYEYQQLPQHTIPVNYYDEQQLQHQNECSCQPPDYVRIRQTYSDFCNYYQKPSTEEGWRMFQRNFIMAENYFDQTGIALEMDENSDETEMEIPPSNNNNNNNNNNNQYYDNNMNMNNQNYQNRSPGEYDHFNNNENNSQRRQQENNYFSRQQQHQYYNDPNEVRPYNDRTSEGRSHDHQHQQQQQQAQTSQPQPNQIPSEFSQLTPYGGQQQQEQQDDDDDDGGKVYEPQPLTRRRQKYMDRGEDVFADFFEEADRMFDDNFFGGGESMLSPFLGGGSRRRGNVLSPFGMMDSGLMKPFLSNMDDMVKTQQDNVQELLNDAEWYLNQDTACMKAIGDFIKLGPVLSSRSSSTNINGRKTQSTKLQVSVQGSKGIGNIKLSATENGIEQLVLQVKNNGGMGRNQDIEVKLPNQNKNTNDRRNGNRVKKPDRQQNQMDQSQKNDSTFLDAEIIDV